MFLWCEKKKIVLPRITPRGAASYYKYFNVVPTGLIAMDFLLFRDWIWAGKFIIIL